MKRAFQAGEEDPYLLQWCRKALRLWHEAIRDKSHTAVLEVSHEETED